MTWPSPLLGLSLLLPLLPLFWVPTGADAPHVFISLFDDIGQQGHGEIYLTCDASGIPEPRIYEWNTTTGILPPYAEPQGAQLLLQPSEESINITFICYVSSSLWTAQGTMNVVLPGRHFQEPIPSLDSPHYSAISGESKNTILTVLNVIEGILLILWLFCCCCKVCCQCCELCCKEDNRESEQNELNQLSPSSHQKKDQSTQTVLELDVTALQETNFEDWLSMSDSPHQSLLW